VGSTERLELYAEIKIRFLKIEDNVVEVFMNLQET
jgi:hypothetical protein